MDIQPTSLKDGYKVGHIFQYPDKTELVYSNETPRCSRIKGIDEVVGFGLQYFIKEYLIKQWNEKFFGKPKEEVVVKYKRRIDNYLGKDCITYKHIEDLHDLGYLPLEIKALPEGSLIPLKVPFFTIVNTKPEFFWLTNFFETLISCVTWGPCTSATTAHQYKKILTKYADETVGNRDFVQWQGHDFSFRGMFGVEAALMSGAGHLLSFTGTDTIPAIDFLEEYYGADCEKELIGGSVPATEHSVMCMGGKDGEINTFERLINKIYPKGIVSVVSDTWDFWQVVTEFLPKLKDQILARDGKLVIRPDSGDPVKIICGTAVKGNLNYDNTGRAFPDNPKNPESWHKVYINQGKYYQLVGDNYHKMWEEINPTSEHKGAIQCMWETFGGTITEKGYKLLDSHIGLIYGDSITLERCEQICSQLKEKGFCSYNVVFGIGSYTYQYVTRDTFGFAIKATYGEVDGEPREIFKQPKTDSGMKNSARGLLHVYKDSTTGKYVLQDQVDDFLEGVSCLDTVFKDGKLTKDQTLQEIRERLNQQV